MLKDILLTLFLTVLLFYAAHGVNMLYFGG